MTHASQAGHAATAATVTYCAVRSWTEDPPRALVEMPDAQVTLVLLDLSPSVAQELSELARRGCDPWLEIRGSFPDLEASHACGPAASRLAGPTRRTGWIAPATAALVLGATACAFLWIESWAVQPIVSVAAPSGTLTDMQKESLALYADLTKLLIGFATGGIGGATYFVRGDLERSREAVWLETASMGIIFLSLIASAFMGHLVIQHLADTLSRNVEFLTAATSDSEVYLRLRSLLRWQYYAFMVGLSSAAVFAVYRMTRPSKR